MTGGAAFGRVEASASGIVAAAADDAWRAIVDWGGFPLRANMPGVTGCELIEGPSPTRRLSFANGLTVTEMLLHQDGEARRLYCSTVDEGATPWRNYLATLTVDAVDPQQCRVTVRGWCDVVDPATAGGIAAFLEQSWTDGIIAGVGRALGAGG